MLPRCQGSLVVAFAAALLFALGGASGGAKATEQHGENVTFLGAGFTGRPFALQGDVVLETDGTWNCLRDYGDPALPGWIAWQDAAALGGQWREVLFDDGLAAVLRDGLAAGVQLVDYADPAAPVVLGELAGTTYRSGLLRQPLLFLALESLIVVYDISDPGAPAFRFAVGAPAQPGSRWFCTDGDLVYFIESATAIHVLDVAVPLAITDLGTFAIDGDRIDALATSPGALHALVAVETTPGAHRIDLVTLDLTEAAAPAETDRQPITTGLGAHGLQLVRRDTLLLAAENQSATHAFDVSSPTLPVAGYTLAVPAERLAVTDTRVLTFAGQELRVHARTAASEPPSLLTVRCGLPSLRRLSGTGPVLLAQPEKDHSLLIAVDAADPEHPRLTTEFETGLDGDLVHHGDVAVMVAGDDLQVVDVSDPASPTLGGTLRLSRRVSGLGGVLASGILALQSDGGEAVVLVDVGDLGAPVEAGCVEGVHSPLAGGRGVLLVADDDQTVIVDIRDPQQPLSHGPLPLPGAPLSAAIAGPRAYCLTDDAGTWQLSVVDIVDAAHAQVIAVQTLEHPGALSVHGQRLFVVGNERVDIVDIAHPGPPTLVAWFTPAFSAIGRLGTHGDLVLSGTNLTVARDLTWRPVAAAAVPAASRVVAVHPNPFNPRTTITFSLAEPRRATVAVHDLRGRRVATLVDAALPAGRHQTTWSGTDHAGRPLPSGVYLVRLTAAGLESSRPVTLLK